MKSKYTIMALIGAFLALPLAATAQEQMASAETAREEVADVKKKSMGALRRELYKSEEEFYALYNKLNDDAEYDVSCFYETPTGTRQKNHVCRAKFVTDSYGAHAARNRGDVSRVANQDANPLLAQKMETFQAKIETLVGSNPGA